jgi:hypothetical protein
MISEYARHDATPTCSVSASTVPRGTRPNLARVRYPACDHRYHPVVPSSRSRNSATVLSPAPSAAAGSSARDHEGYLVGGGQHDMRERVHVASLDPTRLGGVCEGGPDRPQTALLVKLSPPLPAKHHGRVDQRDLLYRLPCTHRMTTPPPRRGRPPQGRHAPPCEPARSSSEPSSGPGNTSGPWPH